ncbi:MAG: hypothetical protein Q9M92_08120 [Enterobacterales bacterium]|nr:hypothetical protein [Enterobacterales bacterium]
MSQDFIERLDTEKAGKLDVTLNPQPLPEVGLDFSECISQLENNVIPQLSAARGSRFWGFVTGGATPMATMADWLVAQPLIKMYTSPAILLPA